jgi:transposase InsO family protein
LLYIEPGSPWENGYCESFNGKLRDDCLNGEIFYPLKEAQIVIEKWRVNTTRSGRTARSGSKSIFTAYGCDIKTDGPVIT